jgi:hypothetical protein
MIKKMCLLLLVVTLPLVACQRRDNTDRNRGNTMNQPSGDRSTTDRNAAGSQYGGGSQTNPNTGNR